MKRSDWTMELVWKMEHTARLLRENGYGEESDGVLRIARELAEKAKQQASGEAVNRVRNLTQLDLFQ